MKKFLYFLLILIVMGISLVLLFDDTGKLVASKLMEEQVDDFLLRIHVEEGKEGIKVLHSIQYLGEEDVEVTHRTPLVSISLDYKNHDFTGSPVTKIMKQGEIYYQEEVVFPQQEKGISKLYVHAQFYCAGDEVNMEYVDELKFQ